MKFFDNLVNSFTSLVISSNPDLVVKDHMSPKNSFKELYNLESPIKTDPKLTSSDTSSSHH